jgi:hypothetical protein
MGIPCGFHRPNVFSKPLDFFPNMGDTESIGAAEKPDSKQTRGGIFRNGGQKGS